MTGRVTFWAAGLRCSLAGAALALAIFGGAIPASRAGTIALDPSEDFNNFGKQPNFCLAGIGGVCFAASAINSFFFLENQYPAIYGNKLTPNGVGAKPNQTDPKDATSFAMMTGAIDADAAGYNNFVAGKMAWLNKYAPGTTSIISEYVGSASNNSVPTLDFLSGEIQKKEDVEMFVVGAGVGHAIDLVSISCGPPYNVCGMRYQDPNDPTTLQPFTQLTAGPGGALEFFGLEGFAGSAFTIQAAFSESPVPEPSSWILMGSGLAILAAVRKRKVAPALAFAASRRGSVGFSSSSGS
jgi:PEP-CTERM motif